MQPVDVLIITALAKERDAVLRYLGKPEKEQVQIFQSIIILVGIMGGVKGDIRHLGDLIIPEQIVGYEQGKVVSGSKSTFPKMCFCVQSLLGRALFEFRENQRTRRSEPCIWHVWSKARYLFWYYLTCDTILELKYGLLNILINFSKQFSIMDTVLSSDGKFWNPSPDCFHFLKIAITAFCKALSLCKNSKIKPLTTELQAMKIKAFKNFPL